MRWSGAHVGGCGCSDLITLYCVPCFVNPACSQTVSEHRVAYIRRGVYLIVEQLQALAFRTFVKRVCVPVTVQLGWFQFLFSTQVVGCMRAVY
mgnify:CR=1 FL=1